MEQHRIATWWVRWEDLNWPNPDNYDKIRVRAEKYAKADVTAAMIFGTHFRWDWLPVFPILHDYFATVAEELHQYGVKLFDHHSVNLVHRYSTREEMRRVIKDSGPHLPFSPTWEAAASWEYKGKRLNDWRMIDVKNGKPLYYPQYTAESFCHRNPEYKEAYQDYVKTLIRETQIDGLSADDAMHYMHYSGCGCRYCREDFKRRTGMDLPPVDDLSFWGNCDNPAWLAWIDSRFDATGEFYRDLSKILPENFRLTGCGEFSASASALEKASDARRFMDGCNYVNVEMTGNTPPYKHDPKTNNVPFIDRVASASHHQAVAREHGAPTFATGFAFTTVAANHVWAISKLVGSDAWIGTLKGRLGLPDHILNTLPNEEDIVGEAFGFEAKHPELFRGELVGQLAVYFSYETRNHTYLGNLTRGYFKDYRETLALLFRNGICPHTVFEFPKDAETYPILLLPSALKMTQEEIDGMHTYLAAGGKVVITGPTALPNCRNSWKLPASPMVGPDEFFFTVPDGIKGKHADWMNLTELVPVSDPDEWQEPEAGIFYHPHRISDKTNAAGVLALCEKYMKQMPLKVKESRGYLTTMFDAEDQLIVHFLAEDYDVDIDHKLDEMRYHRSRVNFINRAEPIGVDGTIVLETDRTPEVYTPFHQEPARIEQTGATCKITLPDKCSYAILRFKK